ncbi:MAG: prolipoprotein diacylglyceryl transferase family protein [Thermoguttaceae bacterium]
MRQTLFYIPNHIAGIPVLGFGLLLLLWVVLSAGLLVWLAWRGRLKDEWLSYLTILVPVGLAIWFVLPYLAEPRGLPIRSYGMMMLLAVISGTALAAWRAKRAGFEPDLIYSLAFWTFVPGILGARAFYVIEYWDEKYWPIYQLHGLHALLGSVVNVAEGGLVVYGSVFGAAVGLLAFVRKYRLPLLPLADVIAPSLLLGLALGRVGCLLNGCCFGGPCDYPWAVSFPYSSPPHTHQAERGQLPLHGILIEGDAAGRPEIAEVVPGSAAEAAGLAPGDVVRQINGTIVDSVGGARWALLEARRMNVLLKADNRSLTYWHIELPEDPGEPLVADRPGGAALFGMVVAEGPEERLAVTSVDSLSPAARQGIQPGWEVVAVSGRLVRTPAEFRARVEEFHQEPWIEVRTVGNKVARWPLARPPARSLPVHPTQLYSVLNALFLFLLLLAFEPFQRRDGELIALALTLYAVTRYLIEDIRTDEAPVFGIGLSISQTVSLLVLLALTALWFYILRQKARC